MASVAHPQIVEAARLVPVDHRSEIEPRVVCSSLQPREDGDGKDTRTAAPFGVHWSSRHRCLFRVAIPLWIELRQLDRRAASTRQDSEQWISRYQLLFRSVRLILACNYRRSLATWSARKAFLLARLARIYPVYLVALLASYFVGSRYVESVSIGAIPQFLLLQSWIPYTASIVCERAGMDPLGRRARLCQLFYVSFPLAIALAASASDRKLGGAACRCPPRSGAVRREPRIAARSVLRVKRSGAIELRRRNR